ncbi:YkoF family thiamine/hydroxymethylpyrimidine-binding protein [Pleionea sp. CnH1-48]|uniref:YkoF family thiamine/hydroxymethylpyrimidine-binding protein n=1 Tax=Pleionea sp. CnH1-48 TaxID=2954494 RepID=UPI002097FCB7|nr:YkoF family thiamine/hydroxymethylpyrimidine-binding protein [Pleionea sp. CnH1-48]MCO7224368.1 thiamine-binding protein [Pleionea sp. CnH1-48]
MKLVAEISLYPLQEDYVAHILTFIERINEYENLEVQTHATCTIIKGDYQHLMSVLATEMERSHQEVGQAIFVCKFLKGDNIVL